MSLAFPKPEPRAKERKPLRRTARLKAKRWGIRPRRPRRLEKPGAGAGQAYMAWVRTQPCVCRGLMYQTAANAIGVHQCQGRMEANHGGRKPGVALKADDTTCFAMCSHAHRQWTDHTGMFKGWSKAKRRAFADERAAASYSRYLSAGSRRVA